MQRLAGFQVAALLGYSTISGVHAQSIVDCSLVKTSPGIDRAGWKYGVSFKDGRVSTIIVQPKGGRTIASDYEPYHAGMSVFKQLHPAATFNDPSGAGFTFAQVSADQQVTINQWLWSSAENTTDNFLEVVLQCPKTDLPSHK